MNIQEKFNQKDSILVISDYPEISKHGEKNYGIAWYTKETIEPIAKKYNRKFIVLAENDGDNSPRLLCNNQILLLRIFDPRHHSLFPVILKWLLAFNKIGEVYIHSEFCTNGGFKNFILLPLFLLLIRLSGKKIVYFSHNVIADFSDFAQHLNLPKNKMIIFTLNQLLKIYYFFLGALSEKIVVMDEEMKRRLSLFIQGKKILSLPFWIKESKTNLGKDEARKSLKIPKNKFVLLYFGFITWYKGADWLIDQVANKEFCKKFPNIQLILAGGEAYSLKDKKYYQNYYISQLSKARTSKNVQITGFVSEKDIPLYFTVADAVVFPYRGLIGSSGALTYALTFRKPFLLSSKMKSVLNNNEYSSALRIAKLFPEDITFELTKKSFLMKILKINNAENLIKLQNVSKNIAESRGFSALLPQYYENVFCATSQKAVNLKRKAAYAYSQLAES